MLVRFSLTHPAIALLHRSFFSIAAQIIAPNLFLALSVIPNRCNLAKRTITSCTKSDPFSQSASNNAGAFVRVSLSDMMRKTLHNWCTFIAPPVTGKMGFPFFVASIMLSFNSTYCGSVDVYDLFLDLFSQTDIASLIDTSSGTRII